MVLEDFRKRSVGMEPTVPLRTSSGRVDRAPQFDFGFSCRNHIAFDFANLFAETVMQQGLAESPHFRMTGPTFTDTDFASLIGFYLDNVDFRNHNDRQAELETLVDETRRAIMLSDYMYAMAALPLALEPIQKIRFIPYAHQRFQRFLRAWETARVERH